MRKFLFEGASRLGQKHSKLFGRDGWEGPKVGYGVCLSGFGYGLAGGRCLGHIGVCVGHIGLCA